MTDQPANLPVAGWYPDPAGSPRTRWWNGTGWTESYSATTPPTAAATPWSSPADAAPAPYPNLAPYSAAPVLRAPEGTSPSTPFIWIIALLPAASLAFSLAQLGTIDVTLAEALDPNAPLVATANLLAYGITLVIATLTIVFAFLDSRALAAKGVPRPFHWAWSFFALLSAPVYMIGRSVVARRRTGSGLAPMFVNLAIIVLDFGVAVVTTIMITSRVLETIHFS
jgi:hypothetical protein